MAIGALVFTIMVVALGYRYYASRVDRDILQADAKRTTPAKMYNDGVDFMPANASVLFGYQFKSIAALGPIVGPITAAQFGWLAAIAWLVVGVFLAPLLAGKTVAVGFIILTVAGVLAGQMTYRWKQDLLLTTLVTVGIALVGIWFGTTTVAQNFVGWINGLAGAPEPGGLFTRPLGYGGVPRAALFWGLLLPA